MIKLKRCRQCGKGPIDTLRQIINGEPADLWFECQWCGRFFDQDEIDYFYFEESAIVEGLKLLYNYAAENGAKPDYLEKLNNYKNRLQKELEAKYEVE